MRLSGRFLFVSTIPYAVRSLMDILPNKRDECAATSGLGQFLLLLPPSLGKGSNSVLGTGEAWLNQITVQLFEAALLLAPLASFCL